MDKSLLEADFFHIRHNFELLFFWEHILGDENVHNILENQDAQLPNGKKLQGIHLSKFLKQAPTRSNLIDSLKKTLLRSTVRESFEVIRDYCSLTGQFENFKLQQWYMYARVVRNSCSHDFKFDFDRISDRHFPIEWNGKRISLDMEGLSITQHHFDYKDCLILLEQMETFINEIN